MNIKLSASFLVAFTISVVAAAEPTKTAETPPSQEPLFTSLQRLQASLKIKTVSATLDSAETQAAFAAHRALLERAYPKTFETLQNHEVGPYSVLLEWKGSDPSLKGSVLMGHQDIVPVEDAAEWQHPPYAAVESDGFIWGRGALDNKSGVIGILEAVEQLIKDGYAPKRTLWLAFGHDEETDGRNGAAKIVAYLKSINAAIDSVLDEGLFVTQGLFPGLAPPLALIGVAEKGYLTVDIHFEGEGGHSSVPPNTSSIVRLGEFAYRLEQQRIPPVLTPAMRELISILAPVMPQPQRFVMENLSFFETMLLHQLSKSPTAAPLVSSTIAMTMARAGVKDNVVPKKSTLTINARILPGQTPETVLKHLKMISVGFEVEIVPREATFSQEPSAMSCFSCPNFKTIETVIKETFPEAVVGPGLVTGGTDSRHFSDLTDRIYRFVPMVVGPDDVQGFHGLNEKVSIENFNKMIEFYSRLIRAWDA
mgnify:CR=1 FL=1